MKYLVIIIFCFSFLTSCKKDPVNSSSPNTIYKVKYVVKSNKTGWTGYCRGTYLNEYGGVSHRKNIIDYWDTTLNIASKKIASLSVYGSDKIYAEIYVNDKLEGKATSLGAYYDDQEPVTITATYNLP